MRFVLSICVLALALALAPGTQGAAAACASGVTRTVGVGPSSGAHARTAQFLAEQVLGDHEVVLTFDDGPLSGPTQSILRTLDAHCVRATFFMVGSMARADPDLVRQVADAGHTIGIHTWSHANLSGLSRAAAIRQIRRGYGAVSNALGDRRPAAFFRFPYLAGTASLRRYLSENALTVFGSPVIDSEDYRTSSGDRIVRRIMARLEQRGRGVILMHDIKNATAAMLPSLLDALDENGYSVVHLVSAAMIPSSFGLDPGPGEPQTASRGSSSSGASARLHTLSAVGDRQPNHGLRPDDIR